MAIYLTLRADAAPLMFALRATFGLGAGFALLLQNYSWAAYYGRGNLSAIWRVAQLITLLFAGLALRSRATCAM
jgi:hypothetical protein